MANQKREFIHWGPQAEGRLSWAELHPATRTVSVFKSINNMEWNIKNESIFSDYTTSCYYSRWTKFDYTEHILVFL